MPMDMNIPGFLIKQGSKHTRVSSIPELHRVLNMPESFLNMSDYT